MLTRNRLGAFALLAAGIVLLSACGGSATPTAVPAAAATATPTPCPCSAPPPQATPTTTPTAGPSATPTTAAGDPARDVKVGFVFATSGADSTYGLSQKAAAQMAIDEIDAAGKGPKLVPVFEDTAGNPDNALAIFRKFINTDKVDAIVGPTLSTEAVASDPEAQKAKVPVLAVSNTAGGVTDAGDYVFRDSLAEFQIIPATVKEAKDKLNLKKVSLMYANDDAFSKSGADVFRTELQKNDIKILSEQTFSTSDTDFKMQLQAVKAEHPDAIVVSALAGPAQIILQQARNDVGIDPNVAIIGGNGFNSPAVVKAAGPAAEGLIVGAPWNPNSTDDMNKEFVANFSKANGKNPDQLAAQAYAGVYILDDAIMRADLANKSLEDSRSAIRDALKNTKDVPTVLGPFSFTDKRDANHPPVVQIVTNGAFGVLN
jgi:branched-chain amino acid transport system substrate-binding protein